MSMYTKKNLEMIMGKSPEIIHFET